MVGIISYNYRCYNYPYMRAGLYTGEKNPKWKGGKSATNARKRYRDIRPHVCKDCSVPYEGKEGCNSLYCPGCRIVLCTCTYCQKDFTIKRKDWDDGRGLFCSLVCYRTHLAVFPLTGPRHNRWTGGFSSSITRRARIHGAEGNHTKLEWLELKKEYAYMCLCCKQQEPFIKLTEDHIMPLSMGGSNDISNIQPLCWKCNNRKRAHFINYIEQHDRTR